MIEKVSEVLLGEETVNRSQETVKETPVKQPVKESNEIRELFNNPPVSKVAGPTPTEGRRRTTFNLNDIGKIQKTAEEKPVVEQKVERVPDKPIDESVLAKAWQEFAQLRKHQVAEYSLLNRAYTMKGTTVVIPLSNSIEEPMLQNMRTSLITFLRDRLGNSSLMVIGELQEIEVQKKIYTTKEKFEHFADKNPVLRDMKERFGLDPDLS